ncbi:MAG TPA: pyridine nucleotide-disulfide oxidoreductase, partial [Myxococcales bacterium]
MERHALLAHPPSSDRPLGIPGFRYSDLHDPARLADLTAAFDAFLRSADEPLFSRYDAHRGGSARLRGAAESELLLQVGAQVSRFVARLFEVEEDFAALREAAGRDAPIFRVKREFVQRRVFRKGARDRPHADDFAALDARVRPLLGAASSDPELEVARLIEGLLEAERAQAGSGEVAARLDLLDKWLYALSLQPRRPDWALLRLPHAIDFQQLVPLRRPRADQPALLRGEEERQRRRDGFRLTDPRMAPREVRSQIDFCIYCHEREKDSCSRGFPEKDSPHFRKNPLGIPLTGCPLSERISEMHTAAREGDALSALALVCIDNPMAPGTGHRICNDCMKACIYQKQDPVDIPQIETRVLDDVLRARFGFEIWSLLTRWNPLRFGRQHPRPYSGVNALVVGMGPAGYTLAHHLLNEGFGVVGIDGLKIEPLPEALLSRPVERFEEAFGKPLDQRITSGFGGV